MRTKKLKHKYTKKQATASCVWDNIDKRWVEGLAKNGEIKAGAIWSNTGVASRWGWMGLR